MDRKFTIVLCLKNSTHSDGTDNIERFVRIGMPSYERFLDVSSVEEFIIIAPKDEHSTITQRVLKAFPKWPWKLYADSQLLHAGVTAGWARQQTAKLTVSHLVRTELYIIIDDDTFLTKPFLYNDLRDADGRIRLNREQIDFPFFFLWSNQLLDYDFDKVQDAPFVMGITPEIFHTSTVKELVKYLVGRYGAQKKWQLKLQDNKFTEYGLYWIYLLKNDLTSMYSMNGHPLYDHAVTNNDMNLEENIAKAFHADSHFSFVQSSLKYSVDKIAGIVSKYITKGT